MRLRVPVAILIANILALSYIWFASDLMRQMQVMTSVLLLMPSSSVLFLWFVLFSGAPGKTRLTFAVTVALIGLGFAAMFRVRGFTGDLIPIVEFRFAAQRALPEAPTRPDAEPPAAQTTTTAPALAQDDGPLEKIDARPSPTPGSALALANPGPRGDASDSQDWPQYLGPNRSGVVPNTRLETDWAARPPKLLWRQPVGAGWSGFAVSGGIAITQEQRGDEERVIAYDLRTGRPLWSHGDSAAHDSPLGGLGPRAVPTINGEQVFTQGATGLLNALDLHTGRLLWSHNILKENSGVEPEWGVAVSPLVHRNRVIVSAGGAPGRALVAYDRNTGELAWASGNSALAYSSPALMTLADREQIVMLNKRSVAGHDAETGVELWTENFPHEQPNVAQPLPLSANRVLFSVGYGIGSKVYEISPAAGTSLAARLVWSTPRLKSKFANMVAFEGSVYGLDDGVLVCLDPETGERRWKAGRFGHGQLILVGKQLLIQTEGGEILLVEPNPERLIEIARFRAVDGKAWNPPAFAAPILLVRTDLEAVAYELPLAR